MSGSIGYAGLMSGAPAAAGPTAARQIRQRDQMAEAPGAAERQRPYHHGDLRRALLAAAVKMIAEAGPGALSLRALARRIGVSHAAPAHHFSDKAGLLTAV